MMKSMIYLLILSVNKYEYKIYTDIHIKAEKMCEFV